jgi:hypothetical protein
MPDSQPSMDDTAMQSAIEEIRAIKESVLDLGRSVNVDLTTLPGPAGHSDSGAKKRGAPRGNTNALKHGYYSKVLQEQGPDGVSRSVVMDFRGEIVVIKDLIFRLYKQGFTSKDAEETASCLRAISWASLALCRLVQTQDEFTPLKPVNPLAVMRSKAILSRVEGTIERLQGGIDRLYKPTLSKR